MRKLLTDGKRQTDSRALSDLCTYTLSSLDEKACPVVHDDPIYFASRHFLPFKKHRQLSDMFSLEMWKFDIRTRFGNDFAAARAPVLKYIENQLVRIQMSGVEVKCNELCGKTTATQPEIDSDVAIAAVREELESDGEEEEVALDDDEDLHDDEESDGMQEAPDTRSPEEKCRERARIEMAKCSALKFSKKTVSATTIDIKDDPLTHFWENSTIRDSFPLLRLLAWQLLSVSCSNAASERVFSAAGNIVSKKRTRLAAGIVSDLVFLNGQAKAKRRKRRKATPVKRSFFTPTKSK